MANTEYPDIYHNLMIIGLLGSIYRLHEEANKINSVVEATLNNPVEYRMFRAIAQGIGGDSEYAQNVLSKHIDDHPDDDSAKVAMAVSLMMAGNPEWKPLIENVLATSTDQAARESANNLVFYLKNVSFG